MEENKDNGVMTMQNSAGNVQLAQVKLDEEALAERRRMLDSAKIQKDGTDLQLEELEAQLDAQIPKRYLEENIAQLEEDLKNKQIRRTSQAGETLEEATEADLDLMKIKLKSNKKALKLDLPMRDLRLKISELRAQKARFDAPEQQIKKLEKEIKSKEATVPASRLPRSDTPSYV